MDMKGERGFMRRFYRLVVLLGCLAGLMVSLVVGGVTSPVKAAVSPVRAGAAGGPLLPDVGGHWSEPEVRAMVALEVISGFPDGTFRPEDEVTREQFLKLMVSCLGWLLPGAGVSASDAPRVFADVPRGRWSFPYVAAAVDRGVIDLSPDGLFHPERPVTRLEVAEWLTRADPRLPDLQAVPEFSDWRAVPEASREAVRAVAAAGLMRGYPDGRFGPDDALPRSQAAALLWRYLCLPRPCEVGAVYAIKSYEQRDRLPQLDWAAFGWAVLEPAEAGLGGQARPRIRLDSPTSVYRLPSGWEEVVGQTRGLLMVFCDRPEVVTTLLDHAAWWPEVAAEAVAAVRKLGLSGLLLDFEHLRDSTGEGRSGLAVRYVRFLETVRAELDRALPPGSGGGQLVVAVHPANVPGHYDGYDFAGLGRVADRLLLMAHDYHEAAVPSPPAPLPAVARAVGAVIEAGVEPGRLVLGLSLSAHQWVLDRQGKVVRTYTPLLETVYRSIQERTGAGEQAGTVRFDPVAHVPVFGYVRDEGQYEENVVWYEDARSMRAKMAIVHRYGLAEVSLWRLGIIPEVLWSDLLGPRPVGR
ncbi:MAG: S-layer homology domain-containing protein [Bacillota bacterium]|nr:S-layer homology domain-containing protein [Bacillota bacterium]